jgi:hypothetical protein
VFSLIPLINARLETLEVPVVFPVNVIPEPAFPLVAEAVHAIFTLTTFGDQVVPTAHETSNSNPGVLPIPTLPEASTINGVVSEATSLTTNELPVPLF